MENFSTNYDKESGASSIWRKNRARSRVFSRETGVKSAYRAFLEICHHARETVSKNEVRGSVFRQISTKDRPKPFEDAKNTSKSKYFCVIGMF